MRKYLPTALYLAMALSGCQAALPPTQPSAVSEQGRAISLTITPPAARSLKAEVSRWTPADLDHYTVKLLIDNPETTDVLDYGPVTNVTPVTVPLTTGARAHFAQLDSQAYRVEVRGHNQAGDVITTVVVRDVDLRFLGSDVEQVHTLTVPTTLATTFNGELILPSGAALPSWATRATVVVRENGLELTRRTYGADTPNTIDNLKAGHTYEVSVTAQADGHSDLTATATYSTDASQMTLEQVQAPTFAFVPTGTILGTYPVGTGPLSLAVDSQGTVWVSNYGTNTVSRISSDGAILGTSIVGNNPRSLVLDGQGNAWVVNFGQSSVSRISSVDSTVIDFAVGNNPWDVAVDEAGTAWVTDDRSNSVARISSAGTTQIDVGDAPQGVAVDGQGTAWVVNTGSDTVSRISSDGGTVNNIIVGLTPVAVAVDGQGNAWVVNEGSDNVSRISADGLTVSHIAVGDGPVAVALDGQGNAWVVNRHSNTVTKLSR